MVERIVSGTTIEAIRIFKRLERAKRRVKELEIQLEPYVRNIPEGETALYKENIERIKKNEAAKLENFKKHRKEKGMRPQGDPVRC